MQLTTLTLAAALAVSAGAWWGLDHTGRLPTVRMLLALVAGTAGAVLVSSQLTAASAWFGRQVAGLPQPWPELLMLAPAAVLAAGLTLMLLAASPKQKPDRTAEVLAVCACAVLLFVTGASGPVAKAFSQAAHPASSSITHAANSTGGRR